MESDVRESLLSKDEDKAKSTVTIEDPSSGDGMLREEKNVDRISDIDRGGNVYKSNANLSADVFKNYYADHYNPETKELNHLSNKNGATVNSISAKAERDKWLGKKVTPKAPVIKSEGEVPEQSDLMTVGSGQSVATVNGTLENPNIVHEVLPNSLFIDGKASQEDVRQGNVGTCYFLAAILQVLHYDPTTITNMMSVRNGDVYTELYHREADKEKGYHWVRKPVVIKWGDTVDASGSHVGSHYRLKYDPEKEVKWSANFDNSTLKINKTLLYQAAMWVNCLEHAFAGYSQIYGHYGRKLAGPLDYYASDSDDSFRTINGGYPGFCLHMIYGDDVQGQGVADKNGYNDDIKIHMPMAPDENKGLLDSSDEMMRSLAVLSQTQDGSRDVDMHIGIWDFARDIGPRMAYCASEVQNELLEHINKLENDADKEALNNASKLVEEAKSLANKYTKLSDTGAEGTSSSEQTLIQNRLHEIQISLAANEPFIALNLEYYPTLRSTMATIVGRSGKDIYMYTRHVYNVREIHFISKEGDPIDVDTLYDRYVNGELDESYIPGMPKPEEESAEEETVEEEEKLSFWQKLFGKKKKNKSNNSKKSDVIEYKLDLEKLKSMVDLDKSTAIIQNPHGQTKAVYPGETESERANGTWTTSLRDLLAHSGVFTAVTVKNHRHENNDNPVATVTAVEGAAGEQKVDNP